MGRTYFIDDTNGDELTHRKPMYTAPLGNQWNPRASDTDCPGCGLKPDSFGFHNRTWHDSSNYNRQDAATQVEFYFTGSAVEVYAALARAKHPDHIETNPTYLTVLIDDKEAEGFIWDPSEWPAAEFAFNKRVFSTGGLDASKEHKVVVMNYNSRGNDAKTCFLFDYARYAVEGDIEQDPIASGTPSLTTTESTSSTEARSSSTSHSSSQAQSDSNSHSSTEVQSHNVSHSTTSETTQSSTSQVFASSSSEITASSEKAKLSFAAGAGLVVGIVGVVLIALAACVYWRRRRNPQRSRESAINPAFEPEFHTSYALPTSSIASSNVRDSSYVRDSSTIWPYLTAMPVHGQDVRMREEWNRRASNTMSSASDISPPAYRAEENRQRMGGGKNRLSAHI
ncbi:hypothetical protein BKA62DRAFT_227400 [Auriculariales sp. MPI-PUGE-AT-0066]|nr:hypothetical protein BKA62DRAFT_227400 [Auriculariales sp. MPI-PUGE-AT-0066]